MSFYCPFQQFGLFKLGVGFSYQYLHRRFGFDFGERYHRDPVYRIETGMHIDRCLFEEYRRLDLGEERPIPRVSIEPFGHRFMPVMYGCDCLYMKDMDPCGSPRPLSAEEIDGLEPWTVERFERDEHVREVLAQARAVSQHRQALKRSPREFNPHCRALASLQNLGSVVNTGFSVQGDGLFVDYLTSPETIKKLYAHITDLMLLCLRCFPEFDGEPLQDVFIGNCSVAMLSPGQYMDVNYESDRRIMDYARQIGARFTMHQDSDVTPHLENYARFDYLHGLDFGQDTDFARAARLMPEVNANCMLLPGWLESHGMAEIREELLRLMRLGLGFKSFTFTLYEIDTALSGDWLCAFHELFRECANQMDALGRSMRNRV